MKYPSKEFCIEVTGESACFTRPDSKVERVSYDVITPSAARAIIESIFWKPEAIRYEITKIEVLKPIKWVRITRNEVGATAALNKRFISAEKNRAQRNTVYLKDVAYRIYFKMVFVPRDHRNAENQNRYGGEDETLMKYVAMFQRRCESGQWYKCPYLGCREFSCDSVRLISDIENEPKPVNVCRDLGIMLYDKNYTNPRNISPMFFHAKLDRGVMEVPVIDSGKILI